ncbi:hypothetical protein Tsubulata_045733 [Turnera subulata]|uniref:Uncharacterized protein n=1 Tax=Turnera subulata TaxID=218843 RepID=A0A9Q0FNP5_9ROSI|nr:hypothetical protein Tsubulata_045733 [Turnera subulata]
MSQHNPQQQQQQLSVVAVPDDSPAQNGGSSHPQSLMSMSEKLEEELRSLGLKIKRHEDNMKLIRTEKNKLEESILDLQVILGKHSSATPETENNGHSSNQSEEETAEHILRREKSAAGIFLQLKRLHISQAYQLSVTKDVLGVVAMLGRVDDDSLSRSVIVLICYSCISHCRL